jgi:hypothetical protein
MVFFIPWRVVAEDSGAAQLDLLGPPGWCSGCWPHDGDVAGGADSFLVIFRFGATLELGRSERTTMRPLLRPRWSYGVIAKVRHRKISAIGIVSRCAPLIVLAISSAQSDSFVNSAWVRLAPILCVSGSWWFM